MSDPRKERDPDDIVSTPEGDNEYTPDEPAGPADGLQTPNGNAPTDYDWDKPVNVGPGGANPPRPGHSPDPQGGLDRDLDKTVDKLSLGQILT
jgi:hypothetical protein